MAVIQRLYRQLSTVTGAVVVPFLPPPIQGIGRFGGFQFEDMTAKAGIPQLAAQYVSWGTTAQDFDNDGLPDVFIVHGGPVLRRQDRCQVGRAGRGLRGL